MPPHGGPPRGPPPRGPPPDPRAPPQRPDWGQRPGPPPGPYQQGPPMGGPPGPQIPPLRGPPPGKLITCLEIVEKWIKSVARLCTGWSATGARRSSGAPRQSCVFPAAGTAPRTSGWTSSPGWTATWVCVCSAAASSGYAGARLCAPVSRNST